MKRIVETGLVIFFLGLSKMAVAEQAVDIREFYVYKDATSVENRFLPSSWIGNYEGFRMNYGFLNNPYSGETCIEISYTGKKIQGKDWAGIYWMPWRPPSKMDNLGIEKNNSGQEDSERCADYYQGSCLAYDLTGITKLTFWAKGEKGGEIVQTFRIGGFEHNRKDSSDSCIVEIGPIKLTDFWKRYTISLTDKDLSYITGGFAFIITADLNPEGCTFYLDEIKYE